MRGTEGSWRALERLAGPGDGALGPLALVLLLLVALAVATRPPPAPVELSAEGHELAVLGTLDVNRASTQELEALPGIGPSMSARLVEARPFEDAADLERVRGIGPKTRAKLAPLVVFSR